MFISDFNYHLPADLVARKPLPNRDDSRMMIVDRKTHIITHAAFKDFRLFLGKDDVVVLNNTKVMPVRTWGKAGRRTIEVLFIKEIESGMWETLCKPARSVRVGDRIMFKPDFEAEVTGTGMYGKRILRFPAGDVRSELKTIGYAPLPPYIKRKKSDDGMREFDLERYQTVFAKKEGAIAAPTAGLHFTPRILEEIGNLGVRLAEVTLEVGQATFQPVRVNEVEKHVMLDETYDVGEDAARTINEAKASGRQVTAVGTTVARTLESAWKDGRVEAGSGKTSLFIYPGFEFHAVDHLLTNFHLPQSSLLMLVAALAGRELILQAYEEAVRKQYRFFSYGDCMLIL